MRKKEFSFVHLNPSGWQLWTCGNCKWKCRCGNRKPHNLLLRDQISSHSGEQFIELMKLCIYMKFWKYLFQIISLHMSINCKAWRKVSMLAFLYLRVSDNPGGLIIMEYNKIKHSGCINKGYQPGKAVEV